MSTSTCNAGAVGGGGLGAYKFLNVNADQRYRFTVKERFEILPDLTTTASLSKWSDPNITRDFFESEYQREVQPNNFMNLVEYSPNFTISALARPGLPLHSGTVL